MPTKAELRRKWNNETEKVILHQYTRCRLIPNASPYPIKFETYLRMAEIPYENDFTLPMSSKGKSPWMTFKGQDMADSQLCMEHLAKTLDKNLSAHLTPEERSMARGIRAILEDHLYFVIAMLRWNFGSVEHLRRKVFPDFAVSVGLPRFMEGLLLKKVKSNIVGQCKAQGIGRHTKEEIENMGRDDLRSISEYLGSKQYLFGDKPVETDCVLFGFMAQLVFAEPKEHALSKIVDEECTNLKEHCLRVKEKYWPDWEGCLFKQG